MEQVGSAPLLFLFFFRFARIPAENCTNILLVDEQRIFLRLVDGAFFARSMLFLTGENGA